MNCIPYTAYAINMICSISMLNQHCWWIRPFKNFVTSGIGAHACKSRLEHFNVRYLKIFVLYKPCMSGTFDRMNSKHNSSWMFYLGHLSLWTGPKEWSSDIHILYNRNQSIEQKLSKYSGSDIKWFPSKISSFREYENIQLNLAFFAAWRK